MKLVEVQVQKFRNIVESSVEIEPEVTCLVGKNGSGKTTFLHALHRLRPVEGEVPFDVQSHYPAWLEKLDRQRGKDLKEINPIQAIFELEEEEVNQIETRFGAGTLREHKVVLARSYGGDLKQDLMLDEAAFVENVVEEIEWPYGTKTSANDAETIEGLRNYAQELAEEASEDTNSQAEEESDRAQASQAAKRINEALDDRLGDSDTLFSAVWSTVEPMIPQFLYFDEYSQLPYSVDIKRVLTRESTQLDRSELTARSLLRLGGAEDDYLTDPDFERRTRELENVSNSLTRDLRKFWTQNPELRVEPRITKETVSAGRRNQGQKAVVDELKLRIRDNRHWLSLPFDKHSSGFRWFYSFLATFSKYEYTDEPLVILLDEPALGLHARAQADFLRYIEDRLAPRCQVVYTTHSPFMVQPGKLERVRLLEDKTDPNGEPEGVTISADVTSTDPDTLFPLQGALGYDLVQHLFIGPHNLVVEGTSDYTYLTVISDYLGSLDEERITLDDRWSIVPVGGASQVPSFVALLGSHLDVTVLVDARKKGHQRLMNVANEGVLRKNRILTVGGVLDRREADIEDVFTEEDYLRLYNRTFGKEIALDDLQGQDPIVRRVARYEGEPRFDHGLPADELLRHRDEILPDLSKDTLDRFEDLFAKINDTLEE